MAKAQAATKSKDEETYKFEVGDLAKALGIQDASARVALRAKKVEKAGKKYGWDSQKAFDAVVAQLSSDKKAKKADNDEDSKPAKKAKKK